MVMWRIIVGVLLASLLAVGAWSTSRTATMADRHPTLTQYEEHLHNAQDKFNTMQRTIIEQGRRMEDKIDDIQEYLMK